MFYCITTTNSAFGDSGMRLGALHSGEHLLFGVWEGFVTSRGFRCTSGFEGEGILENA
jgi:hypothetical protein